MTTRAYWHHTGTHQELSVRLAELVPLEGPITGPRTRALEKFRRASNAYYDIFCNAGWNRRADVRRYFRVPAYVLTARAIDWSYVHSLTEPAMDQIILDAAREQGLMPTEAEAAARD